MLTTSLTSLLVEARVEELERTARCGGSSRRRSAPASEMDYSPAAAFANRVRRTIARVFGGGHAVGHATTATWSRQS